MACAVSLALSLSAQAFVLHSHTTPGQLVPPSVNPRLGTACMSSSSTEDPPLTYAEYMAKRTAAASSATVQPQQELTDATTVVPPAKLGGDFVGKVTSIAGKPRRAPPGAGRSAPDIFFSEVWPAAPSTEAAADGEEKPNLMQKVKDAGVAGIISYMFWELAFWGISIPVCIVGYREVTGHWPDFGNQEDVAQLGAEAFAFVNLARFAVPLRIGLALGTVPWVQSNIIDRAGKPRAAPPGVGRSAPDIFFSEVLPAARRSKSQ